MRANHVIVWIAIAALVVSNACAGELAALTAHLPRLNAPPDGNMQWVARSMRLNGLPMTVQTFTSRRSVDEIFSFYQSEWRGRSLAECTRTHKLDRNILGIKTADHYISIEARTSLHGSEGTITVSPSFDRGVRKVRTKFPHPQATAVVNLQEYEDAEVLAEHISMQSVRAVAVEVSEFTSLLTRDGWAITLNRNSESASGGHVIEMQRGAEQVQLTFQPMRAGGKTSITVVWKKS